MRASLALLPSVALALPIASTWPSSSSASLSVLNERAAMPQLFSSFFEKLRGTKSSNYHSGLDGTWDVLEPAGKATSAAEPAAEEPAAEEPAPTKAKPSPPKQAPQKQAPPKQAPPKQAPPKQAPPKQAPPKKEPEEEAAPAAEEGLEEDAAEEVVETAKPTPKSAQKTNSNIKSEKSKSEFLGKGFNPDEAKTNRGFFGLFGR